MTINLENFPNRQSLLPLDKNNREVFLYKLNNCQFTETFYPNVIVRANYQTYFPIREKIMSLEKAEISSSESVPKEIKRVENRPVFFYIYNTDNYFHFVYDTLPYLISYLKIKGETGAKLLMNYPNSQSRAHYKFVLEFLALLDIIEDDILLVDDQTIYNEVYFSNSYTYDINNSLTPPREEIYELYRTLIKKALIQYIDLYPNKSTPSKFYISRRTYLHNDFSNIGTNYTTRRKLINETELVNYLCSKGYKEIFTEQMSTVEKIVMFFRATDIVGALGGGICNALFCQPECNLIAINSPYFMDINGRLIHAFNKINYTIFNDTSHEDKAEFKIGMRVKISSKNIIGEIIDKCYNLDSYGRFLRIQYTTDIVAGWNNDSKYEIVDVDEDECEKLDKGLNSAWLVDMEKFRRLTI